jgi:hypothetical protein
MAARLDAVDFDDSPGSRPARCAYLPCVTWALQEGAPSKLSFEFLLFFSH